MAATPESIDDEHLAMMLMTTWSLRTGRVVPLAPPTSLTEQELIDFWAEDRAEDLDPDEVFAEELAEEPAERCTERPTCCGSGRMRRGSQP